MHYRIHPSKTEIICVSVKKAVIPVTERFVVVKAGSRFSIMQAYTPVRKEILSLFFLSFVFFVFRPVTVIRTCTLQLRAILCEKFVRMRQKILYLKTAVVEPVRQTLVSIRLALVPVRQSLVPVRQTLVSVR